MIHQVPSCLTASASLCPLLGAPAPHSEVLEQGFSALGLLTFWAILCRRLSWTLQDVGQHPPPHPSRPDCSASPRRMHGRHADRRPRTTLCRVPHRKPSREGASPTAVSPEVTNTDTCPQADTHTTTGKHTCTYRHAHTWRHKYIHTCTCTQVCTHSTFTETYGHRHAQTHVQS